MAKSDYSGFSFEQPMAKAIALGIHPIVSRVITCDVQPTTEDKELGDAVAWFAGDTFITAWDQSPSDQWANIVKILRIHGLTITDGPASER